MVLGKCTVKCSFNSHTCQSIIEGTVFTAAFINHACNQLDTSIEYSISFTSYKCQKLEITTTTTTTIIPIIITFEVVFDNHICELEEVEFIPTTSTTTLTTTTTTTLAPVISLSVMFEDYKCEKVVIEDITTTTSTSTSTSTSTTTIAPVVLCETCDEGYTPTVDACVMYTETYPEYYPGQYTILKSLPSAAYTNFGTLVFDQWNIDGTGTFEKISTDNFYWTNLPYPSLNGPMNRSSVWASVTHSNQDIGFSFCMDVILTKNYYIGFGSDNWGKMKINGQMVLEQNPTALKAMLASNQTTDQMGHKWWYVYKVELLAGRNIIEVFGHNNASVAAIGIQIYDMEKSALVAALSTNDLGQGLVFSSESLVGETLQYEYSPIGGYHGYHCPDGHALDTCSGLPVCVQFETIPCDLVITTSTTVDPSITTTTTTTLPPCNVTIALLEALTPTTTTIAPTTTTTTTALQLVDYCVEYGVLYNSWAVTDVREITSSSDWYVTKYTEVSTLNSNLGADSGGKLKETGLAHWNTPNTGATDEVGFSMVGAGYRTNAGAFAGIKTDSRFWLIDDFWFSSFLGFRTVFDNTTVAFLVPVIQKYGLSIRLSRIATAEELLLADGTVCTPYVGNNGISYPTVKIGSKIWTSRNLNETKYRNGDWIHGYENGVYTPITNAAWAELTTEGMCYYNDDSFNAGTDGICSTTTTTIPPITTTTTTLPPTTTTTTTTEQVFTACVDFSPHFE